MTKTMNIHPLLSHAVEGIHERNRLLSRALVAEKQRDELLRALKCFLGYDERFQVAVGGNPIAVERMLAAARAAIAKAEASPEVK